MSKAIAADVLEPIVERLRSGAALIEESKALGFTHNGPLRTALKKMLGTEGYDELMGGKRVTGPRVAVDDTGVPVITSTPRSKGWDSRSFKLRGYHAGEAIIDPDGQRYVRAQDNEKADLIVDMTSKSLSRVRLRLEHGSRQAKAVKKEEKIVEKGEAVKKARRIKRKQGRTA